MNRALELKKAQDKLEEIEFRLRVVEDPMERLKLNRMKSTYKRAVKFIQSKIDSGE